MFLRVRVQSDRGSSFRSRAVFSEDDPILVREVRRRTRVVGTFPDGHSALMLVTARLKYIAECEWGKRRYLDVSLLEEAEA